MRLEFWCSRETNGKGEIPQSFRVFQQTVMVWRSFDPDLIGRVERHHARNSSSRFRLTPVWQRSVRQPKTDRTWLMFEGGFLLGILMRAIVLIQPGWFHQGSRD